VTLFVSVVLAVGRCLSVKWLKIKSNYFLASPSFQLLEAIQCMQFQGTPSMGSLHTRGMEEIYDFRLKLEVVQDRPLVGPWSQQNVNWKSQVADRSVSVLMTLKSGLQGSYF